MEALLKRLQARDVCAYQLQQLCCFMNIKNLSSCQVCWTQELSCYYVWINNCQDKANWDANALSYFSQKSLEEEKKLQTKNIQIFYCL